MPNGSAFNVIGGELGLFPNASQPWHDKFQIGDVPDSGDTLSLAFAAVVVLLGFDAAMRRCPSRNVSPGPAFPRAINGSRTM
jgi:hypothetical protein